MVAHSQAEVPETVEQAEQLEQGEPLATETRNLVGELESLELVVLVFPDLQHFLVGLLKAHEELDYLFADSKKD